MPRSLQEWKQISHKYYAPVSTPYPTKDSILYQRESNNPYWQRRYNTALSAIHLTALNYTQDKAAQTLLDIADAEEQKEFKLINKFLPQEEIRDTDTLIDKINILMQNRQRYQDTLRRIDDALSREKSSGAPNMSSLFATYLQPILVKKMEQFQNEFMDLDDPEARYKQLVNEAMREASTKMARASRYENPKARKKNKRLSIHGGAEDWRDINKALKSIPGMWDLFVTNVTKAIGNWDDLYERLVGGEYTPEAIQQALQLNSRTFSIGGNVKENAAAAVAIQLNKLRGGNNSMQWSIGGGAITAEQNTTTDYMVIFSADTTINAQGLFDYLNEGGDQQYISRLQETVQQFSENLDNLFGVFTNAKNYSIGTEQKAVYEKTISGTFEELPSELSKLNVQVNNIQDFLITAYNTGAGAIAESMRDEVEDSVINALRIGAAKIMFDDFATIGNVTGGNLIHLYDLDGKFIPSSVVFRSLGQATNESAVKVTANITLPESINDLGAPDGQGWPGSTNLDVKWNIYDHWQKEFQDAQAASKWQATFYLNLKRAIKAW